MPSRRVVAPEQAGETPRTDRERRLRRTRKVGRRWLAGPRRRAHARGTRALDLYGFLEHVLVEMRDVCRTTRY